MNILIYFDGENRIDSRGNSLWNVERCLGHACFNSLIKEKCKIKIILSEISISNYKLWGKDPDLDMFKKSTIKKDELDFFMDNVEVEAISDEELIDCFNAPIRVDEIYKLSLEEEIETDSFKRIKSLILEKTGDFQPDLVVSYGLNLSFLQKIFENKIVFVTEWGIFSRKPFPQSIYFDPIVSVKNSFLNTFSDNIKNFPITEKDNRDVELFKNKIKNLFLEKLDISDLIKPYKEKFRKLILCPLTGFSYIKGVYPFVDDQAVIRYIMKHIAPDIGVVFTAHPGHKSFSLPEICYYREKYPNFIFLESLIKVPMPSVALFPYVDAMINLISLTGVLSMIWDLPIIPLYGHYNDWLKDCDSLDEIETILSNPVENKNKKIFWYFTHFAIFENRFSYGQFYKQYFEKKLKSFNERGITFDFYEQNEDFAEVSEYIIKTLQENIENSKERPKEKGVFLFGKLKILNIVRLKKEISVYFLKIKIMHISFSLKKLYLFGIPIMSWNKEKND